MTRLLVSECDTHDHECEHKDEPVGRVQCSGQVPLGVISTVAQPWGHITQVGVGVILAALDLRHFNTGWAMRNKALRF